MDANKLFGIAFLTLGLLSLGIHLCMYLKIKLPFPMIFWKLDRMQKFWGKTLGYLIHVISYVIVPIAFGLYLLSNA